jgi:acyl-CoA hydrolase
MADQDRRNPPPSPCNNTCIVDSRRDCCVGCLRTLGEIAFITAARFGRCLFVTVSIDRTDFKHPIPAGSIVELVGLVVHLGRTSVQVKVDVYVEDMFTKDRLHAVTGTFTMVAIDKNKRPTAVIV